jgi:putative hydrolase of the HAD superfamily
MPDIEVLLFDVGGVLLTNAWDRDSRALACEKFNVDREDFEERHALISTDFETGKLTLDDYLQRTVFHQRRDFTKADFFSFMKQRSRPFDSSLALVGGVASSGRYLMATLNNESRELNDYRIETFGLREYFSIFFSSCYLGVRKPAEEIYLKALDITQCQPEQCVFIDDRQLNLECAALLGVHTILFDGAETLRSQLVQLGVAV